MRRQRLDILGVKETLSHWHQLKFRLLYMALESGAVHVEGKALLVLMEDELTMRADGATDTELVSLVPSGDVEHLPVALVYAPPRAAGLAVCCK